MAGLARLDETSLVGICMAIGALAERYPRITGPAVGARRVTLLARDLPVQSGQWISRLRVIKLANVDAFPLGIVMALQAILPQPALVFVLMARRARLRDPEERAVQVLQLDCRTLIRRDVGCHVTLVARQSRVPALQTVSSLFVVEGLDIPLD